MFHLMKIPNQKGVRDILEGYCKKILPNVTDTRVSYAIFFSCHNSCLSKSKLYTDN